MNINLTLPIGDVQVILNVLGKLPTESGVYPLMMEIKRQGDEQLPKEEPKGD